MTELHEALLAGIVSVTFTKVNGEIRHMKCTLNPVLAPDMDDGYDTDDFESKFDAAKDLEVVWDFEVEKNYGGWRSFKPSRVTEWDKFTPI